MNCVIAIESPLSDDVRALVAALNEYTFGLTPVEYRHHMTVERMAQADTTLFVARDASGAPLGMGALRRHANSIGEVKRMFVKPDARGLGVGGAILERIEALARQEDLTRVVLETGSNFDAAQRMYERSGFKSCEPVLGYAPSVWTAFYAKALVACPCCGKITLNEVGGYETCGVCGWEDDLTQRNDVSYAGGANAVSLSDARRRFASQES